MKTIIFAGPSLSGENLLRYSGFEFRPPAVCGDIAAIIRPGLSAIGLIDGIFHSSAAVWHKEILLALTSGIRVFGAASMGALRAAECHGFGMIGLGRIFDDYRHGRREADADVAVAHAPAELAYAPLSVALVDVEATLDKACAAQALNAMEGQLLLTSARGIHYIDRTWPQIVAMSQCGIADKRMLLGTVLAHHKSQKTEDALLLLQTLLDIAGGLRSQPSLVEFSLNRTVYLKALQARSEKTKRDSQGERLA